MVSSGLGVDRDLRVGIVVLVVVVGHRRLIRMGIFEDPMGLDHLRRRI